MRRSAFTFLFACTVLTAPAPLLQAEEPAEIQYETEQAIPYLADPAAAAAPYAQEKCKLDFYHPAGGKGWPTVVYYHGGGLRNGDRSIPAALKNRGWGVVGVSYRLHPKVSHPVYIEDAAAALAWVFKNVEAKGGDPARIFVTGISAGGYLTAMIGLDKSYLEKHGIDADRIAALIPVTGQMITHQTVRVEQGIEPSRYRPTIDKFAPLYHVRKDAPPTLCVTGGWEVDMLMRAEENQYFVGMMKLVGHTNIRQIVIEGADHARCGKECWPHVTAFIGKTLADMKTP